MALIKLSRTERHRLSIFITCLVIAVVFWLFFALSNKYVYSVVSQIQYKNLPENKAFHPLQQDSVKMQIEGSGWQLLFSRLPFNTSHIEVDLESLNKQHYVVLSEQFSQISQQLEPQRIVSISPDTLYFDFSTRAVKKVPVKLQYNVQFKKSYGISAPIKVFPDEVTISGPKEIIGDVEYWLTDSLKVKNADGTLKRTVNLLKSDKANINTYPDKVEVVLPIEEFTEKLIDLPIRVINNNHYDVKLLPGRVKLTVLTPLSTYTKIDKESFEAAVDLKKWSSQSYNQLPVQLLEFPPFCKLVKQEPQTVDFIIHE